MSKNNFVTSRSERFGYYGFSVGLNMIYMFITFFLAVYYTNALGIPPAAVATIFLVARIWDAINDPLLAILIEKANLKSGKFKPWIKAVSILIPVLTVAVFSFTDLLINTSMAVRISYAAITYILWGMVYTVSDAPSAALATVMSDDPNERSSIISFTRLFAMLGIAISMAAGPYIVEKTGGNWTLSAIIISFVALVSMIGINLAKERVTEKSETPTLGQIFAAIFKNRYVVTFTIVTVLYGGFNFGMSLTPYIAGDVFKDPLLSTPMMMVGMIPMIICAPLVPRLIMKFGKRNIYVTSISLSLILSVLIYFSGYNNFTLFIVLSFIRGVLSAPLMIIGDLFYMDAIEYDYYKTGHRFEAAVFSARTFSAKMTTAISGGLGLALMAAVGYQESVATQTIVQTASTVDGLWAIYSLGPVVGSLLGVFVFAKFYDLSEEKLSVLKKSADRKTSDSKSVK